MNEQFVISLISASLLAAATSSAHRIYVSPDGKETAPGTLEQPLDSIQEALERAQAGDSVVIRGGRYPLKREIRVRYSGSSEQWLTVQAYENENVWIDGAQLSDEQNHGFRELGIFNIESVQYVRVKGIGVVNSHNAGFMVRGSQTRHIELIDCRSDRSYNSGIGIWYAEQVRVLHCEVTGANDQDMRTRRQKLEHEAPHEAISLAGARFFDVASNEVHHCMKEGIDCKEVSAHGRIHDNLVHDMPRQGLYADAWFGLLEDVEFDSNQVTRCEWGAAISVEGAGAEMNNVRFHHNVIFNNICSRNYAFSIATFAPPAQAEALLNAQDVVIENNWLDGGEPIDEGAGTFSRNYPYPGKSHFDGNPMFMDPEHGDFRLQNASPALGKGRTLPAIGGSKNLGAL